MVGSWLEARADWTCLLKSVELWESNRTVQETQMSSSKPVFPSSCSVLPRILDPPAIPRIQGNDT